MVSAESNVKTRDIHKGRMTWLLQSLPVSAGSFQWPTKGEDSAELSLRNPVRSKKAKRLSYRRYKIGCCGSAKGSAAIITGISA